MAVRGIEALAESCGVEIACAINPDNTRLQEHLAGIGGCEVVFSPCATNRFQGIRNRFGGGIRALETLLAGRKPDLLLCIQGDIEQSSAALVAARNMGIESVSYLALPHSLADMGATLGRLRDLANRSLLNAPCRHVVISEGMARLLRGRGATRRIDILPNGIECTGATCPHRASPFTLGMLGRIEFRQKRHDFMLQAFCDHPNLFGDCRLVIAGDGPDAARLRELVGKSPRRNDIDLQPWQKATDPFFSGIDMLVIPSRYEGVPLVMLEALARGIPVIGSNRDGMKELLPDEWLFDPADGASLAEAFDRARKTWERDIVPLRQKVLTDHSLESFKAGFRRAILQA